MSGRKGGPDADQLLREAAPATRLLKLVLLLACVAAAIAIPAAAASATAPALRIDKALVNFGNQPFDSLTVESFTVTNKTSQPLLVRVDEIQVPDDFSPGIEGSTCVLLENTPVPAGESCIVNVSFFLRSSSPVARTRSSRSPRWTRAAWCSTRGKW